MVMDGRIGWMDGWMDGWIGWIGWMVLSREVDVWGEVKEGIPDRLMSVEFGM